jgi:Domain of unknown function (DUF3418)
MEAGRGFAGLIGCTQPRRIAATTVAQRIAEKMGEEVGRSVGYKIRFDDRTSRNAFLKIMTDRILLMEAQTDPLLRDYDTIIIDEALSIQDPRERPAEKEAEASRIFIRSTLVAGEIQPPLAFLVHNRALIEKIVAMDEKVRRHDLLVDEEESEAFAMARRTWEKKDLKSWDFGDLPMTIALHREGGGTRSPIRPSKRRKAAFASVSSGPPPRHSAPIVWGQGALRPPFPGRVASSAQSSYPGWELKLWAAAFGGTKVLENALCKKVMHDLLEADIRTAETFLSHAERVRPLLLLRGQEVLRTTRPLLKNLYDVTELFRTLETANRANRPFLSFLAALRDELANLLPADFLIRYDNERLCHIGRYLRALAIRAELGAVHLEKILVRGAEIRELGDRIQDMGEQLQSFAPEGKRKAIEDLGWMIEEYKVSLFAQELKTPFPISRKRIDARMEEIQRML